jgi:hypothetical protein
LAQDLQQYHQVKGPFTGGQADGLGWWESLPVSSTTQPLKAFAVIIFSIAPHAADAERLFSDLGGTQSVKRCNLSIETFETLGKLRSNYAFHLFEKTRAAGKSTHRQHRHMHTRPTMGINMHLVKDPS